MTLDTKLLLLALELYAILSFGVAVAVGRFIRAGKGEYDESTKADVE